MKFAYVVGAAVAAIAMAACTRQNNTSTTSPSTANPSPVTGTPAPPTMTTGQSLNTAGVLAQARVTSETASPYAVNGGSLTLTDTSDTTESINVN